jgi:hypothetical protein
VSGPDHRDPEPSELGRQPDGAHAVAERGDAGAAVDDAPTEPPATTGATAVPEDGPPTEHPDAGEGDGDGEDPSEHHRWGDTAYGSAVE